MNIAGIVTELVAGGVGGNIAGAVLKKLNLGPIGNTIAGALGGAAGGQLLGMLLTPNAAAAAGSGDMASMIPGLAGGGIGGIVLTAVVGLIKNQMAKTSA